MGVWSFAAEPRPNILFIMSDDHAAHAISAYGSKINKTPQIDRLAKDGMRFTNCFVTNSICTPSRAAILTGKYSHLNGVPVFNRFDGSQPHLAKHLQSAGYYTAMIGKWHLMSDPTGFDYWNILPGQGRYHDPDFVEMGKKNKYTGYATDIITDLTLDALKNRPKDKPFFVMCHNKAPHREWSPDAQHAKMFENVEIPEPPTLFDDYKGRSRAATEAAMRLVPHLNSGESKHQPPEGVTGEALVKWSYQWYMRRYLACVASVDDNVGRVLDYLDQNGLRDNTLVIYTSDQGFFLGDHGWYDKRFMYEESLRMPFLVRYPPLIKAGSINDGMILNVDFAPTLLDLAGVTVPADMQGRSFIPLLRGKKPPDWRTSMYYRYYHDPGDHNTRAHYGVRTEHHKLIFFNKIGEWELYDLQRDPREMNNVFNDPAYSQTVKEMKAELERLRKELKDDDQFTDGVVPKK